MSEADTSKLIELVTQGGVLALLFWIAWNTIRHNRPGTKWREKFRPKEPPRGDDPQH